MTVELITSPSPRGVLDHTARFLADRPAGERTAAVVPRAYLKRELRDRLLDVEEGGGWLGARVLTFSELFDHYLNHLPGRPVLTASQVRQVVAALIRQMHAESEGRWFEGQVIGDRVSEATLRSLTRLLLELEPADLPVAELQERLATGARSEELNARAREAVELFRRYRARLESGGYLGPRGQEVAAAGSASQVAPPHGLARFRVLGVDGQFPTSPHVTWIEAAASHPDVERVEVVALLPDDLPEEAWAVHANEPLYERWTAEGAEAARTLIDPASGADSNGDGGPDREPVPRDLEALGRAPFAFRRRPVESAGAVRGVRLPDEQLELDWVAGEVKRLALEEDVPLHEIAVVARDMARRAPDLERRLREMGVPSVASYEARLTDVPAVRALLLAYRLPAEGWPARDLVALAESPYLLPDVSPAVLRRAARREEEPDTGEGWVERLTEMVEEVMEETDLLVQSVEDREVLESADALAAWVDALEGFAGGGEQRPTEWVEGLASAVERWDLEDRVYAPHAKIDEEERLRLARVDLDGLNRLLHGANDWLRGREVAGLEDLPMDAAEFHAELREIASRERIRVSSYPRRAVHLVGPSQAGYRSWSRVFVIGLVDGVFPAARESDEYLLTEEERRAVNLPTRAQRSARERLLFQLAAGSARDRLTLTAPAADDRGKALVTSPFLTHLGLRLDDFEVTDLTARDVLPGDEGDVRSERDAELLATARYREVTDDPAASPAEVRKRMTDDALLRGWLGRPGTDRARSAWAVARMRDDLERVLRENPWEQTRLFEDRPAFGEYAGLFLPAEVPEWIRSEEATFSPSAFRSYRGCRFRFFLGTVLGLRERVEAETGHGEAGAFGTVQHRILEKLYRRLLDEGRLPPSSGEAIPRILDELEEVAREVLQETTGSGHEELWRLDRDVVVHLLRRFVAWDLTEMLRAEEDPGHGGLRTRIEGLERRLGTGRRPVEVEALEETFRLRGTIDRVEAVDDPRLAPESRAANGSLVIRDYKTGRWARQPGPEQFLEGKALQLPLYARMLRRHEEEYGEGRRHIYGFGVLTTANPTRSGRLDVRRARVDDEGRVHLTADRQLGDNPVLRAERAALREAAGMVKEMRAGRFAPSPDPDTWGCPMGPLCCQRRRGGATGAGGGRRFEMPLRIGWDEYRRIAPDAAEGAEDGAPADAGGEAAE
ncbi:MAG: PD-(D/E)XK nuclease family protein [Candidatus Palauibacterales bacterium]|nr:PD-(D/E)XK nuclease family protein [Candidatus Palauibacterales bacterium]